jgi:magnesium chelatase subunit I
MNSHNTDKALHSVLPYSYIVGQEKLKLALELTYIAPAIGGVLISGKRGTAKSTTARAFAAMMYGKLPITIPINATEDRVVGGWDIPKLLEGKPEEQPGLLREAHEGMLYIDEVNLLDDHIVNIILDVTSTGKLIVQREGINENYDVYTTLVGTMNPEEGSLRPQLLDRFGLMVAVDTITDRKQRRQILDHVLRFDQAIARERNDKKTVDPWLAEGRKQAAERRAQLEQARKRLYDVRLMPEVSDTCVRIAEAFGVDGHRADYLLAMAACAYAAHENERVATPNHVGKVAELVLRHRQRQSEQFEWNTQQESQVIELLAYG